MLGGAETEMPFYVSLAYMYIKFRARCPTASCGTWAIISTEIVGMQSKTRSPRHYGCVCREL